MGLDLLDWLAVHDGELMDEWPDTLAPTDPPADVVAFVTHDMERTEVVAEQLATILHRDGWRMLRAALHSALRGEVGPHDPDCDGVFREADRVAFQRGLDAWRL